MPLAGKTKDYRDISPQKYLAVTIAAIFAAELAIMTFLNNFVIGNALVEALIDSALLSLTLFFINYRLMARPLIFHTSALREAEERLRDAIESTSDGFVLFDGDDRLVLSNQKYRDVYKNGDEFLVPGTPFESILRAGIKEGLYLDAMGNEEKWIAQRIERHHNPSGIPVQEHLRDGRWIHVRERPTSEGGIVGVRTDITDLKEKEAALQANEEALKRHILELEKTRLELEAKARDLEKQREKAEAANTAKSQFLSIMSHELRTPLNAVIGFSEIIRDELFGPVGTKVYKNYAGDILESGTHLLLLVDDLLDMSRIESGSYIPVKEDFDPMLVVQESMRLLDGRARAAEVALACDAACSTVELYADKRATKQIVINLLTNAVKFNKPGGSVTVTCEVSDKFYSIAVTDTGIGVAKEDLPRMLEPFAQLEREKGRIHEGAGLGLPLSKSLVEAHGGTLEVESVLGEGTTVTVTFPMIGKEP